MKGKSLFLSAALSTFILVLIGGVLKASANGFFNTSRAAANPPTSTAAASPTDTLVPTSTSGLSPEAEAAVKAASDLINRTDVYSVDTTKVNGIPAFKVTFSSGDQVYVSTQGKILLHTLLTTTIYRQEEGASGPGQVQPLITQGGSEPTGMPPTANPTPVPTQYHDDGGGGDD